MRSFPNILFYQLISTLISGLRESRRDLCNGNAHVEAKPPFYLAFVLIWFCSNTCQTETLFSGLREGLAFSPLGLGIALGPGEPRREVLTLSPQLAQGCQWTPEQGLLQIRPPPPRVLAPSLSGGRCFQPHSDPEQPGSLGEERDKERVESFVFNVVCIISII